LIERLPSGERPPLSIICWYSGKVMPVIVDTAWAKLNPSVENSLERK
jgi:hypothetical protein